MKLYIKNNGKILGPLDWDRILTLQKNGRFSSDVTVSEDKNNWLTIEQVKQLSEQDTGTSGSNIIVSTVHSPSLPQSSLRLQLRQEENRQADVIPPHELAVQQPQQVDGMAPQLGMHQSQQAGDMPPQQSGIQQVQQIGIHQHISNGNNNHPNLKYILFSIGIVVISLVLWFGLKHKDYFIKGHNSTTGQNTPKKENGSTILEILQKKEDRISTSGLYTSQISSIMSDFSYQNTIANNINQQICNGTYRTVELLNILAKQKGCSTSSIMSDFSYQDTVADNIFQQICNGTYRTVELLNIIAKNMGCSTSGIMSDFSYQNTLAKNINQQICNGRYRTVELLNLIAKNKGCSTTSIMSNFSYQDTASNNIFQQICNGKYRTVELLDIIAQDIGCSTSDIMSNFRHQDTMANNINQQICNGTYRTVELLNLIAKKIDE